MAFAADHSLNLIHSNLNSILPCFCVASLNPQIWATHFDANIVSICKYHKDNNTLASCTDTAVQPQGGTGLRGLAVDTSSNTAFIARTGE